jgi:hypothetical protein
MSAILPRAEKDSSRSGRKDGQTDLHVPQRTQREISLRKRSRKG